MTASTLGVDVLRFGTTAVKTEWGLPPEAFTVASVMLGIEQLARGQGTILTDADLETDDDG